MLIRHYWVSLGRLRLTPEKISGKRNEKRLAGPGRQIQRWATPDRQHWTALWDFACMHACMYRVSLTGTVPPVSYLIEYQFERCKRGKMMLDSVQLYKIKGLLKTNFEAIFQTSKFLERRLSVLYQTDRVSVTAYRPTGQERQSPDQFSLSGGEEMVCWVLLFH